LKLIFLGLYNDITPDEDAFLNLLTLETFQYTIFFIDYIVALSLSAVLICYINNWLTPVNFIMKYFTNFAKKYMLPLTVLIVCATLVGSLYLNAVFGLYLYNYENFWHTWIISFMLFTRGTLVHQFSHAYLDEDYEYIVNRVSIFYFLIGYAFMHFLIRYFIINISVAAFLNQFAIVRKQNQRAKSNKLLKELFAKKEKHLREEEKDEEEKKRHK
jgi:hypothetical protein